MKERIGYYDVARGLGIIFVVIGHIDTFYMPFRQYVISFHMALFLIVSGMLMLEAGEEKRSFGKTVGRKWCRIMIPYFLFSFLSIGIEVIRIWSNDSFNIPHLRSLLITTLTMQGISVMWFLPTLFLSELIFLAVRKIVVGLFRDRSSKNRTADRQAFRTTDREEKCCGRHGAQTPAWEYVLEEAGENCRCGRLADVVTMVLVITLTILAVWWNFQEQIVHARMGESQIYGRIHEVVLWLIRSVFSTLFVSIGYFVRKYIVSCKISSCLYGGVAIVLLAVSVYMSRINPGVDLRTLDWGETSAWIWNYYFTIFVKAGMYVLGALTGALGILFLCKASDRYSGHVSLKLLAFLGTNSLIIMATHLDFHVLHLGVELANIINRWAASSHVYHVCLLVFVFAGEAVLIRLINRYAPFLTGKFRNNHNHSASHSHGSE